MLDEKTEFIKSLVNHIRKHMDFGARECPFCFHHYNHDADCLYSKALEILDNDELLAKSERLELLDIRRRKEELSQCVSP